MEEDEDIDGRLGDLIRKGVIQSVDLGAGLAVFEAGDIVSPPLPWIEAAAGAFRTWTPPSKGEQVILISPEGDIEGGIIMRGLLSNKFPAPSSDANHSIHGKDGLIITLVSDGLVITAPSGVVIEGDVTITGELGVIGNVTASEDVTASGISLKEHKHGNVQAGAAKTGAPE
jgi:phage baseplate assembly protein V